MADVTYNGHHSGNSPLTGQSLNGIHPMDINFTPWIITPWTITPIPKICFMVWEVGGLATLGVNVWE